MMEKPLKELVELNSFKEKVEGIHLQGQIYLREKDLTVSFKLEDLNHQVQNGFPNSDTVFNFQRAHELWKDTCFEAFWALPGKTSYWELNFSTSGQWNLYYFFDYRNPQPPKESFDFDLQGAEVKLGELVLRLKSRLSLKEIEGSLCAVIKTKHDQTFYLSTSHQGLKPDFHLRKSLNLKIQNT